jgi:hypothetical protein
MGRMAIARLTEADRSTLGSLGLRPDRISPLAARLHNGVVVESRNLSGPGVRLISGKKVPECEVGDAESTALVSEQVGPSRAARRSELSPGSLELMLSVLLRMCRR